MPKSAWKAARHTKRVQRKAAKAAVRRKNYERRRNHLRNFGESHRRWQPPYGAHVTRALGGHLALAALFGRGR